MSSPGSLWSLQSLLVVIVFQLGLCIVLLGEIAKGAMGYTSGFVVLLQLAGGVTVLLAMARLAGMRPDSADTEH